jgi:tetratricopeptide (TPR) repeat protein
MVWLRIPLIGLFSLVLFSSHSWCSLIDSHSFITQSQQRYQQYLLLGIQAITNKEFELAHQYFDQILVRYPDHGDALYNKAVAYHHSGDAVRAIVSYTEALKLNPTDLRIRVNLAAMNQIRNNLTEAIEHYRFELLMSFLFFNFGSRAGIEISRAQGESKFLIMLQGNLGSAYYQAGEIRQVEAF